MNKIKLLIQKNFSRQMLIDNHDKVNDPEVSIIIPTYNCLEYLPNAIKSIQKQLVSSIEILILDDASTDKTWHYLSLIAKCDQRIKPIRLPGYGVAKARNYGLQKARGQYIAFLDADDYWLPRKLLKQLNFHKSQPTVTLSFCNYLHFNDKNEDLGDCFGYWPRFKNNLKRYKTNDYVKIGGLGTACIFAENVIGTSGVMLNKSAFNTALYFDETLKSAEDWDFWLKASLMGPIGFTSSVDLAYLMRPGSETSNVQLRLNYMQKIMSRHSKDVFKISPIAILQCLSRLCTGYAEYHRMPESQRTSLAIKLNKGLKPCLYHFMAFTLSPSWRLLKATLSDVKRFTFNFFAGSVAKCK